MDAPFPPAMMPCIEKFFTEVHPTLVPGKSIYQEVFDSDLFFPLQRQTELVWMIEQTRKLNPTTIYEIGADKGAGLYHWCMCLPTVKHVIACEIRGTPYASLFEKNFPHIKFTWIEGSSYSKENVEKVKEALLNHNDNGLDVLFIDGDKSNFLTDFQVYLPMMSRPSVIFMHDINDGGIVNKNTPLGAFNQVKNYGFRTEQYINVEDTRKAQHKEALGVPCKSSHEGWLRYWRGRSCGVGAIYIHSVE